MGLGWEALKLVVCTCGIWTCFLAYGIAQEGVYSFEGEGGKFTETAFVLVAESLASTLLAYTVIIASGTPSAWGRHQLKPFSIMSGAQLLAKFASNESLKLVSYPVQALAKSSKTIPAMFGAFFSGKTFSVVQWLCAFGITGGTAAFTLLGKSKAGKDTALFGVLLLAASLFFDGTVAAVQQGLRGADKSLPSPSAYQLMAWTNLGGALFNVPVAVFYGSLQRGYAYCVANPDFLRVLGVLAVCSAFGHVFIFLTIKQFGPDTCAKITTVRKMMTVLVSIFWYNHKVAPEQWYAVALVFLSVITELVEQAMKSHAPKDAKAKTKSPPSSGRKKKD
jgi:drug/metabolite transporter (DMT)-like permease